jgi:two-component system, cell cycle response regulator CtrA
MRTLVAEGDLAAAERIRAAIAPESFVVETAESGEDALELAKVYDFDIAVLGVRLPDMAGAELLRRMRAAELIARLRAIVRRSKGHAASVIRTGRLALDLASRTVEIDGKPLSVTPKEYGILELLSLRRGKTLTKDMFLDHLYGGMDEPERKIVDVFICKLRKKIAKVAGEAEIGIHTVWGQGYTLRESMGGLAEAEAPFAFDRADHANPVSELELLLLQLFPSG